MSARYSTRGTWIILAACLLLCPVSAGGPEAVEKYNEALALLDQGNIDQAKSLAVELLESRPSDELMQLARGLIRNCHIQRYNQALGAFKNDRFEESETILVDLLAGELEADIEVGAEKLFAALPYYILMPFVQGGSWSCPKSIARWIESEVGRIPVSCASHSVFVHATSRIGVNPYVALSISGRPTLLVSIGIPGTDPARVTEVVVHADDEQRTFGAGFDPADHGRLRTASALAISVPRGKLSKDFLGQLVNAEDRRVVVSGVTEYTIKKGDARLIGDMLKLYDALERHSQSEALRDLVGRVLP